MEPTLKEIKKDMYLMLHKTQEMVDLAEEGYMRNKLSALCEAEELAAEVLEKEGIITAKLAKIASVDQEARSLLSVPSHIANITLNIRRIIKGSRTRVKEGLLFSDRAENEAKKLFTTAKDAIKKAGDAVITGAKATIDNAFSDCEGILRMASQFATAHEERLVSGECQPKSSSTYLSILYAFEDMGTHVKDAVKRFVAK